jgi:hypothetical protein
MNVSDQLQQMLKQLSLQFAHASLRGQGRARFVFARQDSRAVEISEDAGNWWLEFWDGDPDVDAAPVKELTLPTYLEAVKEATAWLACGAPQAVLADAKREIPGA